jgi:hypothetical protein
MRVDFIDSYIKNLLAVFANISARAEATKSREFVKAFVTLVMAMVYSAQKPVGKLYQLD